MDVVQPLNADKNLSRRKKCPVSALKFARDTEVPAE
jgi:hypothetical protein